MIKNGVDGIITNKPALLIDVINHPEKYTIDTVNDLRSILFSLLVLKSAVHDVILSMLQDYTWTMVGVAMVGIVVIAAWCFFPRNSRRRD